MVPSATLADAENVRNVQDRFDTTRDFERPKRVELIRCYAGARSALAARVSELEGVAPDGYVFRLQRDEKTVELMAVSKFPE